MNKKTVIGIIAAAVIVVIIGILLYVFLGDPSVDISDVTEVKACVKNRETNEIKEENLTDDDANKILAIVDGKAKSNCYDTSVFSEEKSFIFVGGEGENIIQLAKDGTSNVFFYNDSTYITLSDEEWDTINSIYSKYTR